MPTVPTYDSFQATPEALPGVRAQDTQPGDVALQLGQGEQRFGDDLMMAATRLQRQQNADRIFRAEATIKDGYLQYEQGAKQRLGQDAWGVSTDTAKWWADNLKTVTDGLENDQQRQIFAKTIEPMKMASLTGMAAFEQQQRGISTQESANASIVSSINLAAANPGNSAIVNGAKSDITRRVQSLTQMFGWTPEIRDATLQSKITDLHKQVIQSLVDQDPSAAATYFEANKEEIAGAQRDELDKLIKQGDVRVQGQQGADKIMGMALGELPALQYARDHYQGDVQDDIVRRVKERYGEADQVRERDQKDAADSAWQTWSKTKSINDVPTTVLARMDGKARDALEKEDAAHASGKDVDTNWSKFYDLRELASRDPKAFGQTDIRTYFGFLAPAQRQQLIDLQNQVKGQKANDVQTLSQQLARAHQLLGWGNGDAQRKGQFDSAALTEIDAAQKDNGGRPLSYDDRQKVLDRMMVRGSYPGGSWFGTDMYYKVSGTENAAKFAPKIPDAEKQKITAALQRAGRPVTDAAITELYKLKNGLP